MSVNLFVRNFPYSATEDELKDVFGNKCTVKTFKIIRDRDNNNQSKGFSIV